MVRQPVQSNGLSEAQHERLRHRSKLLFGNRDRLEVMAAIARSADGLVNATDLQVEIDIAQSRVRNQLVALSQADLLAAFPIEGGKRWYKRNDSVVWEMSIAIYDEWTR